ncbi:MAG: hypothetical protein D6768_17425 [Chloroflexi bacterium]|nr:MAG: hypothetical protein D6768_17425 [Chloroflexota bacterium]
MTLSAPSQTIDPHVQTILNPVFYADIFDYPLTAAEIHRFLQTRAVPAQVANWLAQAVAQNHLAEINGYYCLPHKPHLPDLRHARQQMAQTLWPHAESYGRKIAALPFVRMVAVTGALAVNNPTRANDDIDYLIVTQPGRLWLCRTLVILLVRAGRLRGVNLCPNYLITENALTFEQNLFTAREVLQMRLLFGPALYRRIRQKNEWVTTYFPQGDGLSTAPPPVQLSRGVAQAKRITEKLLGGPPGNWLERRLQRRQIAKHTRLAAESGSPDTTIFTPDVCKGHYNGHGRRTLDAFERRVQRTGPIRRSQV